MAVDTGATRSAVTRGLLQIIGIHDLDELRSMNVVGSTGRGKAHRAIIPQIAAVGLIRHHLLVSVPAIPDALAVDGLLGLDFFRDSRLTIDLREQTIVVD